MEALKTRLDARADRRGGESSWSPPLGGGREVEMKLPGRYHLDAALRGALKTAPGVVRRHLDGGLEDVSHARPARPA